MEYKLKRLKKRIHSINLKLSRIALKRKKRDKAMAALIKDAGEIAVSSAINRSLNKYLM